MKAAPPPTIHVVGAQESNYPWGFENRVIPALRALGFQVVSTDYRRERATLAERLRAPSSIVLVCKGEGIPAAAIEAAPGSRVLWYAEQLGTLTECDEAARARRRELAANVRAFDAVFSHDQATMEVYLALGAANVTWASTACVDPTVHKKLNVPKRHPVVFAGTLTPRRTAILEALARHVSVHVTSMWDPSVLNQLFNESAIVLNLHLSDLPNTETRVAEVLGAGSFLLTESLSSPDLVTPGVHVASVETGDIGGLVDAVRYYLEHEDERERIAAEGHAHMHAAHTLEIRLGELIRRVVDVRRQRVSWPPALGILHNRNGEETDSLAAFRDATHASPTRSS